MRTLVIITGLIITVGGISAVYLQTTQRSAAPQAVTTHVPSLLDAQIEAKLNRLTSMLEKVHASHADQVRETNLDRIRLTDRLAQLDERLNSLEALDSIARAPAVSSPQVEQVSSPADTDRDLKGLARISENDLGEWIDESLGVGYWDEQATAIATEQVATALVKVPGVELQGMQCMEGVCRARFAQQGGTTPAIGELFGEPPFVNEGFTVEEADGSVSLYFTGAGVSLDQLRSEAIQ